MTIVLGQGVEHGAPPSVLARATAFEDFVVHSLARGGELYVGYSAGSFTISVDNGDELITTIKELDL